MAGSSSIRLGSIEIIRRFRSPIATLLSNQQVKGSRALPVHHGSFLNGRLLHGVFAVARVFRGMDEGRIVGRWFGKPDFGGNHRQTETDGRDRWTADPLAYHEDLQPLRAERLHHL